MKQANIPKELRAVLGTDHVLCKSQLLSKNNKCAVLLGGNAAVPAG